MSWISKTLMRWDLGLSIFFILLTIVAILYTNRVHSYQEDIEDMMIKSWWCHVDTPHGHIDQERQKKDKTPPMANKPKQNPSKTPRTK